VLLAFALENDVPAIGREIALAAAPTFEGKLPHAREELGFTFEFVRSRKITAQNRKD